MYVRRGLCVRSINRSAVLDRAYRSATPCMQGDQIALFDWFVQEPSDGAQDERVAYPVEPVLPQLVRFGHFLVNWVCFHVRGQGFVEGGVEERDALDVGELFSAKPNDLERGEVVPALG